MPNELEVFEALNVDNRIPKADALEAYYKIHGALCRIPRRNRLCTKAIRGYSKRASGVHGEANPPDPQKSGRTDGQQRSNR